MARVFFQLRRISIRVSSNMCVVTALCSGGNLSIPMLRIAKAGFGSTKIPVVDEISLKILFQRLVMLGHSHSVCSRLPICPQFLQHIGDVSGKKVASL